jgi:hypothetical protein
VCVRTTLVTVGNIASVAQTKMPNI